MIIVISLGALGGGSVGRRSRQEVEAFIKAGRQVCLVCYDLPENKDFLVHPNLRVLTLPQKYLPGPLFVLSRHFMSIRQVKQAVSRILKRESVQLIVSHDSTVVAPLARMCRGKMIPLVFVVHALIWERLRANPYGRILTHLYQRSNRAALCSASKVSFVSQFMRELAQKHVGKINHPVVVPNPVDSSAFTPGGAEEKDIDLLYVGRLSIEKGIRELCQALARMERPCRVAIAGDGPLRDEVSAAVESCPSLPVQMLGQLNARQVAQVMRRAQVLVVPSLSEPQGVVVLEGMASGLPVIGTTAGGIPEMVRDGVNGWLVSPGDPETLARRIDAVFDDPAEIARMGNNARETALDYSMEAFDKRVVHEYLEDLSGLAQPIAPLA